MSFKYNATGVKMENGFSAAPEGEYRLIINEVSEAKDGLPRVTKNGDPYVMVTCLIDDAGEYLGKKVWHNVTFLPKDRKGAGMAIVFLKAINEPHSDEFEVDPDNWVGKTFKAKLRVSQDNQGRPKNEIAYVISDLPSGPLSDDVPF